MTPEQAAAAYQRKRLLKWGGLLMVGVLAIGAGVWALGRGPVSTQAAEVAAQSSPVASPKPAEPNWPEGLMEEWNECLVPQDYAQATEAQRQRFDREINKELAGRPLRVGGIVDEVEIGGYSGAMTLLLRRSVEKENFGGYGDFHVALSGAAMRALGERLSRGQAVVVTGTYAKSNPCALIGGGMTFRKVRPTAVQTLEEYRSAPAPLPTDEPRK